MNEPPSAKSRSAGQIAIAVTVALLGFLLAIQLRSQQDLTERLAIERETDLGRLLTELTARNDRLLDEILELRLRLARSTGSQEQEQQLITEAREQVRALQILLGVVPVTGPGIVVTIADPQGTVGPEVLLDAVQELRDAGAEAIEVGGTRVVASTAFAGRDGDISIDERQLRAPYRIVAIGPPQTLAEAMRIPGGVVDAIGTRAGASVRVEQRSSVSILSTGKAPKMTYARPRPRR